MARGRTWYSPLLVIVRAALGLALLVYVLRTGGGWASLQLLFATAWLVAVLNAVPVVGAAIEARRLSVLFGAQGLPVPFGIGIRVVTIGALFNLWIPGGTGGDVMKLYYLAGRHPDRKVEVATIILVDRAVALFALLVLVLGLLIVQAPRLLAVPIVKAAAVGVAICLALLVAGTIMVWSSRLRGSAAYQAVLARIPLGRHLTRAADAAYVFRERKRELLAAGLLSLVGHGLLVAMLALTGHVLLPAVPALLVSTLAVLGLLANVLPITPGGLGVGEAASEALFRSVNIAGGAGIVAAWRASMLGVCAVGAVYYAYGVKATHARDATANPDRTAG